MLFAITASLPIKAQDIQLPAPIKTGGMPLMEALSKRSSTREFSSKPLDLQTTSNLLWAAWGYNREDKRTAPSSQNKQELELYVVVETGAYLYDAKNNILIQKVKGDVRKATGKQEYPATAPMNIVFVANTQKGEVNQTNAGFIAQNIYLYCASASLGTVTRGWFDEKEIRQALQLPNHLVPILVQTVGEKR